MRDEAFCLAWLKRCASGFSLVFLKLVFGNGMGVGRRSEKEDWDDN